MIVMGQATVPSNSTVAVLTIPSGTVNTCLFQPTPASTAVYIGSSTAVSSTNGLMVPVTPVNQESYVSIRGITYYATTGNATASSFMYLISTGS